MKKIRLHLFVVKNYIELKDKKIHKVFENQFESIGLYVPKQPREYVIIEVNHTRAVVIGGGTFKTWKDQSNSMFLCKLV
jgi:hypothetical protein